MDSSQQLPVSEQRLCEALAPLLRFHEVGDTIDPLTEGKYLYSSFEFFFPHVLREIHNEWKYESLDGLYARQFQKTGEREIELIGLAMFISDQTLTPLHVNLQLSSNYDRVSWIDLRLGERVGDECRREPYSKSQTAGTMLHVVERLDSIDWFYHVGYGERDA